MNGSKEKNEINEKEKALEIAMKQIRKDFGEGSIMKLGRKSKYECRGNSYWKYKS